MRKLRDWARELPKRSSFLADSLISTERIVLSDMCDRVDPAQDGYSSVRPSDFHREAFPCMAHRTLRGHVADLVKEGYLTITHRRTDPIGSNHRSPRTHYGINSEEGRPVSERPRLLA